MHLSDGDSRGCHDYAAAIREATIRVHYRYDVLLDYIRGFMREHGYAPSGREIVLECGISSTSVVNSMLDALQEFGALTRQRGKARTIVLRREANVDCEHWQRNIARAAELAQAGDGFSLHAIAAQLAEADLSREVLIAHGFGCDDDSLAACVANVIEQGEGSDTE